jgi:preprotein translocase subunit SecA
MEALARVGEVVGGIFNGFGRTIERSITSVFGSSNARFVRRMAPRVAAINALEERYKAMSNDELHSQSARFRDRLARGETLDDILSEAFAACREAGSRYLRMRHYDVQMIGGMVLHSGSIAEMVTGEGKTLVATLPTYLNAITRQGVHVVTVNDYLARRDMEWMGPLYMGLGLTVGNIQSGMETDERQKSYACDITYGTNNEFGFDYLRDNMRAAAWGDDRFPKWQQQSQRKLHYAVIDEVDNILIDEARTPLIIAGSAHDEVEKYKRADEIARKLKADAHFTVAEKEHSAHLTDEGVREAEHLAGVESFYTLGNMEWPHLIDNALKAHHLYKLDVNYVIQEGKIIIVDEFTGRLMHGRQWSDGLHQAVEAKERVEVKEETQTLATITLQNYFKLYEKICGMTGTAMTEANEFWKIYKLDVIAIPTNRTMQRIEYPDVIYRTEREKFNSLADEIERVNRWDVVDLKDGSEMVGTIQSETDDEVTIQLNGSKNKDAVPTTKIKAIHKQGRPILVGTVSIEKSERLSQLLDRRGVKHEVLNAKQHKREAEIVAQAGRKGAVTIATNMAGRGTDIILGGNAETMAWAQLQDKYPTRLEVPAEEWTTLIKHFEERDQMKVNGQEVKELGGLYIIGTERHESRRIVLQLRGRSGRQGDPGSSRFFLSLEDDLMRIFAGEWVKNMLTRLGMQEGEAIESRMVTRRVEGAQKKVEERNFEARKNLLEYDEVMDQQRKRTYGYRQKILNGANCRELIEEMIDSEIDRHLSEFLDKDYGAASFAAFAAQQLNCEYETRDFRTLTYADAERVAIETAERQAETQVFDAVDENLPAEEEESEWNWQALTNTANRRWNLSLRDRDLRQLGRDNIAETLLNEARAAIAKVDLSPGAELLAPEYGATTACAWIADRFGILLRLEEVGKLEPEAFQALVKRRVREKYDDQEAEFPVRAGIARFLMRDAQGQKHFDREGLAAWAQARFGVQVDINDFRNKQREEVQAWLVEISRASRAKAVQALEEATQRDDRLFANHRGTTAAIATGGNGALDSLSDWLRQTYDYQLPADELGNLDHTELALRVQAAVEDRYRPEMRRLERSLVLDILDETWKNHLLAMDHLRSSVGLRGYAQVDPKVEFKREGMHMFESMWHSVHGQVTSMIFKMEDLNEDFVRSTFVERAAIHESPATSILPPPPQAGRGPAGDNAATINPDVKLEPIRNHGARVGRNDPCPCGSGKKYKNCCLRTQGK